MGDRGVEVAEQVFVVTARRAHADADCEAQVLGWRAFDEHRDIAALEHAHNFGENPRTGRIENLQLRQLQVNHGEGALFSRVLTRFIRGWLGWCNRVGPMHIRTT